MPLASGVVLEQDGHVIAYVSQTHNKAEQQYSIIQKAVYAILPLLSGDRSRCLEMETSTLELKLSVVVPVEGGGRPESTLRTLLGMLLCSLVSRLSPPNGKESLVTLGVSNRGLPAAGFWWYQSDCRMIHVTNFLQLQVTLPRPFDAIARKSRYNDGIQHGISSDHHETLLSCVWQGRRAKRNGKCCSQSLA